MLEPLGYVGFYSGSFIHDTPGLVAPDVVQYVKQYGNTWLYYYLEDVPVQVVVLRPYEFPKYMYNETFQAEFHEQFEPIHSLSTDGMIVYARK